MPHNGSVDDFQRGVFHAQSSEGCAYTKRIHIKCQSRTPLRNPEILGIGKNGPLPQVLGIEDIQQPEAVRLAPPTLKFSKFQIGPPFGR